MFSERTRWDLRPNRLAERLAAKRAAGARVLDLTESNPTRAGLPYPDDLLAPLARARGTALRASAFGLAGGPGGGGRRLRPPRLPRRARPRRPLGQHERGLRLPLQAAVRPRRRGARAPPRLPPLRVPRRRSSRCAVRTYPLAHDGEWHLDLAALRAAVSAPHARDRRGEPQQPDRRLPEARRARRARGALRRAPARPRLGRGLRRLHVPRRRAPRGERRPRRRRRSPSPSAASRRAAACRSSSSPGPRSPARSPCAGRRSRASRWWPTPTSRSRRPCRWRRPRCSPGGRSCRPRSATACARNLAALRAALGPGCPATLLEPEGGWYAVLRVPATRSRGGARHAPPRGARRARAPRLLLRLPARGVPRPEPAPPGGRLRRGASPGARGPRAITAGGGLPMPVERV